MGFWCVPVQNELKSLPNCEWCHTAAKRPEFRGANLERRSIQRIERLGVRGTDALGGDARLRGGSRRSKPLTQSNASNLAVASWPVDPVTSATHPSGARLNGGRRPISVPFAVHPCLRVARALIGSAVSAITLVESECISSAWAVSAPNCFCQ